MSDKPDYKSMPDKPDFLEVRESPITGLGVFTTKALKAGELVAPLLGEVVKESKNACDYALQIGPNTYLDSEEWMCMDFVNHSCEPNTIFLVKERKVCTIKDMKPGDELTIDYNATEYDLLEPPDRTAFECRCGSENCATLVLGSRWVDLVNTREIKRLTEELAKKCEDYNRVLIKWEEIQAKSMDLLNHSMHREEKMKDYKLALEQIEQLTVDLEYYGPGESPIGAAKEIALAVLMPDKISEV